MAHYALFVANARYSNPGLPPLLGPEQDVDDLCGLFRHRLGYDDAQPLKGGSADEATVSFNRMGQQARPGDTVLFYFAGHGVESLDRTEQYLLFEHADLSELARGVNTPTACLAVSKLLRNSESWVGVQRVFIFDACRVLLAARGPAGAREPRFGDEELLNALARGPVYRTGTGGRPTAAAGAEQAGPPVLIKACLSSQAALELPGQRRGIFSLALGKVLIDAATRGRPVVTGPELVAQIERSMAPLLGKLAGGPRQTPWINQHAPAVPLFTPSFERPPLPELDRLQAEFDEHLAAGRLQGGRHSASGVLVALEMAGASAELLGRLQQRLAEALPGDKLPPAPPPSPPTARFKWLWPVVGSAAALGLWAVLAPGRQGPPGDTLASRTPPTRAVAAQPPAAMPPRVANQPVVDGLPTQQLQALQMQAAIQAGLPAGEFTFADRLSGGRAGPQMVVVPAGQFTMGSPHRANEQPLFRRKIDAFALMKTEVTVSQYLACVASAGCREPAWREPGSAQHLQTGTDDRYRQLGPALTANDSPIVGVSWHDAQRYAEWLSRETGRRYRLPSEAEWEHAASAGTAGRWSVGDDESQLLQIAWFEKNSQGRMQAVAGLQPNVWGLHDMHGNVGEWIQDCFHPSYNAAPEDGAAREAGCTDTRRAVRGGAWRFAAVYQSTSGRGWNRPEDRENVYLGFRLARAI